MEEQQPHSAAGISTRTFWILFTLLALGAAALRHWEIAAWRKTGFDELLYRRYVNLMDGGTQRLGVFQKDHTLKEWEFTVQGTGAGAMPSLTSLFIRTQRVPGTECELPPTRFLYIYTSWLWKNARFGEMPPLPMAELGAEWRMSDQQRAEIPRSQDADHRDPALVALHDVARWATILTVVAGGLFACRMLGRGPGLAVMALMAVAPVQLHISQHAMIDAFFMLMATLCLWTTWECLRAPGKGGWLIAHAVALMLMVLTKENSFFVYCALAVIVLANRWLQWGRVTPAFIAASIVGPAFGVGLLMMLAGGFGPFVDVYMTLVEKAQNLPYAQLTGDGPWYRYLLDLMTVSPIVLILALGAVFALLPGRRELAFLAVFVAASYLIMCNVKYGMNLRYTTIWELPLRAAAVLMIWQLCAHFGRRQALAVVLAVGALCVYEVRQYLIFAMHPNPSLYELVPADLLKKVNILKS